MVVEIIPDVSKWNRILKRDSWQEPNGPSSAITRGPIGKLAVIMGELIATIYIVLGLGGYKLLWFCASLTFIGDPTREAFTIFWIVINASSQ